MLLGETTVVPMPEPVSQCGEKVIFRQVFSGENEANRVKKEKCPFNIIFQKTSLEIEKFTQRLLKFS